MGSREEEEDKQEAFLRWAAEIGISDSPSPTSHSPSASSSSSCLGHSLTLSHFPEAGGRGLAAARELKRGKLVLRVPKAALFTTENVLKDEKLAACVKRHTRLSSTQILTVCLLAEVGKGRVSWWYPYLMQLPKIYHTLANFTQFEIRALQVDDAIWISEKAVLKAHSDWKEVIILMQELELRPQLLTFRLWLWASATISSRALHIPWDDAGCLCPVGDFFNYAAPEDEVCSEEIIDEALHTRDCSFQKYKDVTDQPWQLDDSHSQRLADGGYEDDIASYCFFARKRYRKGDQVLLRYGTYTNLELLEHYGFLLNVNPNDKAFIHLDTALYTSNSWPKYSLYIQQDGRPSFALLSALRLWATPRKLRKEIGHLAHSGSQLSVENEMSVMKWVSKNCHGVLENMPTSVVDDGLLLDVIDNILKRPFYEQCMDSLPCEGELKEFFQESGLHNCEIANSPLPLKAKRSMERWKLAVQWRFTQKKMLLDCISYCNEVSDKLSREHISD